MPNNKKIKAPETLKGKAINTVTGNVTIHAGQARPELDPGRARAYHLLFRSGELLREVVGDDSRYSGPTQRLYRLPTEGR